MVYSSFTPNEIVLVEKKTHSCTSGGTFVPALFLGQVHQLLLERFDLYRILRRLTRCFDWNLQVVKVFSFKFCTMLVFPIPWRIRRVRYTRFTFYAC